MITWVLDIETSGWENFYLGFSVSSEGHSIPLDTHESMWDWYASLDKVDQVVAHNGGRFDFLALIDSNPDVEWNGTLAGSGLVSLRAKGGAECRDSSRLFPMKLADWTGAKSDTGLKCLGPDGPDPGPDCFGEDGCEGYCAIGPDLSPVERRRLRDYCENDCRILLNAWLRDTEKLAAEGFEVRDPRGQLRRTVGSVAYATASLLCDLPDEALDWAEYEQTLVGYYGGRNECYQVRADHGFRADINSAYPWALTLPVPVGRPMYMLTPEKATAALARQLPGVYTARVHVPEGVVPLLPHRSPRGRLLWATGELEGAWGHHELLGAIEQGAKVLDVKRAVIYPEERAVYRPYMEHVWARRDAAKARHVAECERLDVNPRLSADDDGYHWSEHDAFRMTVKFLGNSLSGKLGQSPGVQHLRIGYPPPPDERKGQWDPLGTKCPAWIQTLRPGPPKCARPAQAATLTGRVRMVLLAALLSCERFYCDTDSCYSAGKIAAAFLGGALGAFKDEGPMERWRCRGPKLYAYDDEHGTHVRMKGFPMADESTYENALSGAAIPIDRGVFGVRTALRKEGRAFARRRMSRSIKSDPRLCGTRYIMEDGRTMPLHRDASGEYLWKLAPDAPDPQEILKLHPKAKPILNPFAGMVS